MAPTGTFWTRHLSAEDRLRELWADGYSASVIADKMTDEFKENLTRNAVVGKVSRLNLPMRKLRFGSPGKRGTPRKPRAIYPMTYGGNGHVLPFPPLASPEAPTSLKISIIARTDLQCSYIEGDDHLCCGHPVEGDSSWCLFHRGVVFCKPTVPRSAPMRAAS